MRYILLTVTLSLAAAAPAAAQKLNIQFREGRVTVDATQVPVRTILTEWSKVGGTKVIGAERVAGAPLTIKLIDVPESQALEVILRSVAGYMAAPRGANAAGSMYDRILVMATSSTPPPAAAAARPAQNSGMSGTQRFVPPRRDTEPVEQEPDDDDPNPPNPPVFTFPQPGQAGAALQPGQFPPPQGQFNGQFQGNVNGQPVIVNPAPGTQPQTFTINPASPPTPAYQPATPVGMPTPGMIAPVQPVPVAPGTNVRPPGGQRQR
jgi:hypothetical protein